MRKLIFLLFFWLWLINFTAFTLCLEQAIAQEPRYQNYRTIGVGSYGVVLQLGDSVVKISTLLSENYAENTLLEVAILQALPHQHMPQITAINIHSGINNIYLEIYMPFYKEIEPDDFDKLSEVVDVLIDAHNNDIAHRDIKLPHLRKGSHGLVVIDWGNADIFTSQPIKDSGTTPSYCSPALLLKDAKNPSSNDIWALGISGIEVKHGKEPLFPKEDKKATLNRIFDRPVNATDSIKLVSQWNSGDINLAMDLATLVKTIKPPLIQNQIEGMLIVNPQSRLNASQIYQALTGKKPGLHKKFPTLIRPIFTQTTKINATMRQITYSWLHQVLVERKLHDKIFFEAISMCDHFLSTSVIDQKKLQLTASIAFFLAADFYDEGNDNSIDSWIRISAYAFTKDEFKQHVIDLLNNANFSLLFFHPLREYQNELYRKISNPVIRQQATTLLVMLEISSHTFSLSNSEKWSYVSDLLTIPHEFSSDRKAMVKKLCDEFQKKPLGYRPGFSDIYTKAYQ